MSVPALLNPAGCKRQNADIAPLLPTVTVAQPLHQLVILAVPLALTALNLSQLLACQALYPLWPDGEPSPDA
jgi:hypothetical protein